MILSDDNFRNVQERVIEREATWQDVDSLVDATHFFISEMTLYSDALRAVLEQANVNELVIGEYYIYKAMDSGAGVIRAKKKSSDKSA